MNGRKKNVFPEISGEFCQYKQKVNGTIKTAIDSYWNAGVSLKQLLTDYNEVTTYPEALKKAINPWEYLNKGIRKLDIVSGVTTLETLFNMSAMTLHKQKPVEVIKSIYYRNQTRNNTGLEKVFIDSLLNEIKYTRKLGVINPSPYCIEIIEENRKASCYAVTDKVLANLYKKQYSKSDFETLNDMNNVKKSDLILFFMYQVKEKNVEKIFELIKETYAERVYGIISTRFIDDKKSKFWAMMAKSKFILEDIIIVPKEMSNSSPKKKCLISLVKDSEKSDISIRKINFDNQSNLISTDQDVLKISFDEFANSKTINYLWGKRNQNEVVRKKEYLSAKLYRFSEEIQLSYLMYSNDRGYYAKAYYAATKNVDFPMHRGKSLTPRLEKGLRGKSEKEVIKSMEEIPYFISEKIVKDIKDNYLNENKPVTLKTLWFCMRSELLKNHTYDDDNMREMFSKNNEIANLFMDNDTSNEIYNAVKNVFSEGEEIEELRVLKSLNLIVNESIKEGYLVNNRVVPLLPKAHERASKRQAEVRQALAKRNFEDIEERRIVKFLAPLYTSDSRYLAVMIRLFTGLSIKEVCGLTWRDYQYNKNTDVSNLAITKFVDNNGKIISHALEENWEKYRLLPISKMLENVLDVRKNYLLKIGVNAESLKDYPIILARENVDGMLKGHKIGHCKPAIVAEKCREAVEKAKIPQHIIILPEKNGNDRETDINSYYGDVYKTNFKDKSLNEAGFGLDELSYYVGLKKPDTFSQHYCDYTNEYVQLMIAKKLNRWCAKYDEISNNNFNKGSKSDEEIFVKVGDGIPCAELEIRCNDPGYAVLAEIEVMSENGFKAIISMPNKR